MSNAEMMTERMRSQSKNQIRLQTGLMQPRAQPLAHAFSPIFRSASLNSCQLITGMVPREIYQKRGFLCLFLGILWFWRDLGRTELSLYWTIEPEIVILSELLPKL
jgi:hypothetical protein